MKYPVGGDQGRSPEVLGGKRAYRVAKSLSKLSYGSLKERKRKKEGSFRDGARSLSVAGKWAGLSRSQGNGLVFIGPGTGLVLSVAGTGLVFIGR